MAWDDDLDRASAAYRIAASVSARLRVIAGPGTGKSFALKRRVARLLETEEVIPERILPVTFTRVAAEDLHRELISLNVEGASDLRGRTLHALGLWILRRRNVLDATGRVPRPLNQYEMQPLLYDLPNTFGNKRERLKRTQAYEAAWARLQNEEPGFAVAEIDADFEAHLLRWLRFHESMLIGEIIPELYRYLRDNPASPEKRRFDHILVDEFQDLNRAEQGVIELLGENGELCVVGDDDQSIYSFKHANPEGIRDWHVIHAGAEDVNLLQCRRCPTSVVNIANALIAHNRERDPRRLTVMEGNGPGAIEIIQYGHLTDEITGVATIVAQLVENGALPGDILVLAQRRVIGTPIAEQIREFGVAVNSYYRESELDSVDAQEQLSLLKLVVHRDDKVALRWLLGRGHANFHTNGYRRIRMHCENTGLSPWRVLSAISDGELAIPYTGQLAARFREILNQVEELDRIEDVADFLARWLPVGLDGVDDLREIADACAQVAANKADLLDAIVERITQPDIPIEVAEVRVMSLHRSKGLSCPIVIIAGCVEGLLPVRSDAGLPMSQQAAILEEQRRLFFVGLTRVKADLRKRIAGRLFLTYARIWPQADALGAGLHPAAIRHGNAHFNASRFLRELGPHAPAPVAG